MTSPPDTKDRILDAAERLFAERGFGGTTLRAVTRAADVNLAAVHYHFGSKQALLHAVASRRLGPMNDERLKRIDALEARAAGEAPDVLEILRALVEPALVGADGVAELRRIAGTIYGEPPELVTPLLEEQFGAVAARYLAALGRALPHVPPSELYWRLQFCVGAMVHVVAGHHELAPGHELLGAPGAAEVAERLARFLAAGVQAP